MTSTRDIDIRTALHERKLGGCRNAPDTIVVDELGLSHARVRIDIAVINGCLHGYEIKSSLDTLARLPEQLRFYSQCLEKLTLVCAPRHIDEALKILPEWSGLIQANMNRRGAVVFSTVRKAAINPQVDAVQLAHLLWRPEAIALLTRLGASEKISRMTRNDLYQVIAAHLSIKQLTVEIRETMQLRQAWRGLQERA